jgi:hypothetical protein
VFVVALVAAAGLAAAGCSSDDTSKPASGSSTASQASVDDLNARIQRNEMMFALFNLSALPLHAMDESIAAGTIETTYVPNARSAVRLLALTNWDSTLKAEAEIIRGHAVDLLKALDDGNVDAAKDPAHELHEGYHDFSDKAWAIVAKDLPPDAGGVPAHDDGEATPASGATTTASSTATP